MFRDADTFDAVRPYVKRAIQDEEIRGNMGRAYRAARKVYDELAGEDVLGAVGKLSDDGSVREGLDTTVQSLSEAVVRLSGQKQRREMSWWPIVAAAIAVFVFFNPATGASTRKWVKDHLFGSEEEFDYSTPKY